MATLTFSDGSVWDNNEATAPDKYTTKFPGHTAVRRDGAILTKHGGLSGLESGTGSTAKVVITGTLQLDSSYPTGGEDISEIWNLMPKGVVLKAQFDNPNSATVRYVVVDTGNKKLICYIDGAAQTQAANLANLSAVPAIRFLAVGY